MFTHNLKLEKIRLTRNLKDTTFPDWNHLVNLKNIDLSSSGKLSNFPIDFPPNLENLNLKNCTGITTPIPASFKHMTKLKTAVLGVVAYNVPEMNISGGFDNLADITTLTLIDMDGMHKATGQLPDLSTDTSLTHFSALEYGGTSTMTNLPSTIDTFRLSGYPDGSKLTGVFTKISDMSHMKSLVVYNTDFSGEFADWSTLPASMLGLNIHHNKNMIGKLPVFPIVTGSLSVFEGVWYTNFYANPKVTDYEGDGTGTFLDANSYIIRFNDNALTQDAVDRILKEIENSFQTVIPYARLAVDLSNSLGIGTNAAPSAAGKASIDFIRSRPGLGTNKVIIVEGGY